LLLPPPQLLPTRDPWASHHRKKNLLPWPHYLHQLGRARPWPSGCPHESPPWAVRFWPSSGTEERLFPCRGNLLPRPSHRSDEHHEHEWKIEVDLQDQV